MPHINKHSNLLQRHISRSEARLSSNFADPFIEKGKRKEKKKKRHSPLPLPLPLSQRSAPLLQFCRHIPAETARQQRDNVKTQGKHPFCKHAIWSM
jgi:hypothetical protein